MSPHDDSPFYVMYRRRQTAYELGLDGSELLLLFAIIDRADRRGLARLSEKRLAAMTGQSPRTVSRTLNGTYDANGQRKKLGLLEKRQLGAPIVLAKQGQYDTSKDTITRLPTQYQLGPMFDVALLAKMASSG